MELLVPPLVALKWCTSKTFTIWSLYAGTPLPSGTVIMENALIPLIREAGKAIIMLFRMVVSQCFYVLEPLCLYRNLWKMHLYPTFGTVIYGKCVRTPRIREVGKAIIMLFRRPVKPS